MSPSIPSGARRSARRKWLLAALPAALFVACVSADRITGLVPHDRATLDLSRGGGVVISQIYGGGGNSGATYRNDFVELHNAGPAPVSVEGWSVQYASASGSGAFSPSQPLHGTIVPGGYYLVALAGGSTGISLPASDGTGSLNLSASAGKVALADQSATLGCNGGSTPCTAAQAAHIIDLVGFGNANFFEGAPAPGAGGNDKAIFRKLDGNQDTNDNSADFVAAAVAPRNSASPPNGSGVIAGPFDHVSVSGAPTVERGRTVTLTATLQDASNVSIDDPSATYSWTSSDEAIAKVTATSGNTATVTGVAEGGPVTISVSATSHTLTHGASADLSVIPRVLGHVTLSSSAPMPLVIGYQTVLFVGGTDDAGNPVDFNTVTWTSSDMSIDSVDSRGLVTAVGPGSAVIRATAPDGSVGSFSITNEVPFYSSSARSGHNTEFGVPADADASNDVIIARKQYTISYNPQRGGPNWVSWDLSATHLGSRNRCNCYSADTALARLGYGQYMYSTLDYTGSGYDRGHMEPSADQTTTDGENATTFFMTNFLPQKHGLNAGPWEDLENELRDSVRAGREAYVIAGGIFTNGVGLGTVNNAGKIAIPDSTWKIVIMMPANTGLDQVTSASDVDVFAVNMPNVDTPGSNDWRNFRTSVAKIQASTGYDFLSSLPEAIQCAVEERNCAPVVNSFAGATILVGETYSAQGTFTDAAGDSWTGSANYGDGSVQPLAITGTAFQLSHRYTSAGTFTVTATVRDQLGAAGSASATVTVQSSAAGVQNLAAMLASLGVDNAGSLQAKLDAAARQLANGNGTPAANQLGAFENELNAMVRSGRLSRDDAAPLLAYAARVIDSTR